MIHDGGLSYEISKDFKIPLRSLLQQSCFTARSTRCYTIAYVSDKILSLFSNSSDHWIDPDIKRPSRCAGLLFEQWPQSITRISKCSHNFNLFFFGSALSWIFYIVLSFSNWILLKVLIYSKLRNRCRAGNKHWAWKIWQKW